MKNFRKINKHLVLGIFSIILLYGTLFIKQPGELPTRYVHLGYPVHFYTLDFSGNRGGTSMSGAPDEYIASGRFNILSAWEEFGETNRWNFVFSYLIIFSAIEVIVVLITRLRSSKK